ncbi:hypothetical protein [Halanaeroarchaeum sp. HSR-CO]|uniref:hypothetical protein n=1 Tax=Halanaeroarchaeum sp. HSR-CO TaxID=2866382 RepID=UPI00217CD878|nr:hypothetical protein [Halanaeroarchaeum sp. HSR-CO]
MAREDTDSQPSSTTSQGSVHESEPNSEESKIFVGEEGLSDPRLFSVMSLGERSVGIITAEMLINYNFIADADQFGGVEVMRRSKTCATRGFPVDLDKCR